QPVGDDPGFLCLYHFLKDSFTIIKELLILKIRQYKFVDELFCTSKTTIQVHSADQRFHCVRSHRIPESSSGRFLSFSKKKVAAQADISRAERQRRFTHHARPCLCQLSLRHFRRFSEQKLARYQLQHSVSQKFQPLITLIFGKVLFVRERTVHHSPLKQRKIPKCISDLLFQFF